MSQAETEAPPEESEETGSALRQVILASKLTIPRTAMETVWSAAPIADALAVQYATLTKLHGEIDAEIDAAPDPLKEKFVALTKAMKGFEDTKLASTEAARGKLKDQVVAQIKVAGDLKKEVAAAATLRSDQALLKTFEDQISESQKLEIDATKLPPAAKQLVAGVRSWSGPIRDGENTFSDKQRAQVTAATTGIKKIYDDAAAAFVLAKAVETERTRLTGELDKLVAAGAKPGDIAAGAAPLNAKPVLDERARIAALIAAPAAKVEDLAGIGPAIDGLRKMLETTRATVAAIAAERVRLGGLLDKVFPAGAKTDEIVDGATDQDVAPAVTERARIAAAIAAPVVASAALGAIEAEIKTLRASLTAIRKAVAQVAQDHFDLQARADALPTDPPRMAPDQSLALGTQRDAVRVALAEPATAATNAAAETAIDVLEKLITDTTDAIAKARKAHEDIARPILTRLQKLVDEFDRLKITPTFDFGPLQAYRGTITAARDVGDWPGATTLAQDLAARLAAPEQTAREMAEWRDGNSSKLLVGTFNKIMDNTAGTGPLTIDGAQAALQAVYDTQCNVSRLNWMEFLGIAGANVKVGDKDNHYTTFNDGVLKPDGPATVDQSTDALCRQLFESVGTFAQIHATVTVRGARYHRYWNGSYSNNVGADNLQVAYPKAYKDLNDWYDRMKREMTAKVDEAKAKHGRIANNRMGPDV